MMEPLPRKKFAFLPTPIHEMKNLADSLNIENLWIKRDDMTGISAGGNKTRKLEYIVGDAIENGADTLVTVGAVQSNHCRQTAAVAAKTGLRCILLLAGEDSEPSTGNLLQCKLMGAELKFFPDESFMGLNEQLGTITDTLVDFGLTPYAIPAGGATPLGSMAYIGAMEELKEQMFEHSINFDRIVVASSTGGTLAGMIVGAKSLDLDLDIVGISAYDDAASGSDRVLDLIRRMQQEYPTWVPEFDPKITIDDQFTGEGYGILDSGAKMAIEMFAKMEGIILDPVYTAKAGLALIRMAMAGEIESGSKTLFWHTGGQTALSAYADEFGK
ncbi:MAG: 1-aminocyclopropane-1-carboxylate deaminase/D-cysteine desulfhydrase [Candidatus Thorarchaeota archaeon]